jgi:hypothetical protein
MKLLLCLMEPVSLCLFTKLYIQLASIMHQSYFNSIQSSLILSNQPTHGFLLQTYISCIFNLRKQ